MSSSLKIMKGSNKALLKPQFVLDMGSLKWPGGRGIERMWKQFCSSVVSDDPGCIAEQQLAQFTP